MCMYAGWLRHLAIHLCSKINFFIHDVAEMLIKLLDENDYMYYGFR